MFLLSLFTLLLYYKFFKSTSARHGSGAYAPLTALTSVRPNPAKEIRLIAPISATPIHTIGSTIAKVPRPIAPKAHMIPQIKVMIRIDILTPYLSHAFPRDLILLFCCSEERALRLSQVSKVYNAAFHL